MEDTLDSAVFFAIPGADKDTWAYRTWIAYELLPGWLKTTDSDQFYRPERGSWNEENGILLNGFSFCKIYKYDGTEFQKRGLLIRDHYTKRDVEKIQAVADGLEAYLREQHIAYERENRRRRDYSVPDKK